MASPAARREWIDNAALIVPLLLVNSVALYGQANWGYENLAEIWAVAVGFALAVESIGVYLAAEAHRALLAGDASLRLRLGSYAVGLLAGALNYAHFAPALKEPNTQAIVFGVLSAISPVLWAIRSRSISRDRLRALNLIDGRAVKFTAAQWLLFPVASARAFRAAVWAGETNPARARALAGVNQPVVLLTRLTLVYHAGRFAPDPAALPDDLGFIEPEPAQPVVRRRRAALDASAPRVHESVAKPGAQRLRPQQHPLWDEWRTAYALGAPWPDEEFARRLGEDVTLAAARSRRQRWERTLVEMNALSGGGEGQD
jgi:hypothetical protein